VARRLQSAAAMSIVRFSTNRSWLGALLPIALAMAGCVMETGEAGFETGESGVDPGSENIDVVQEEISLFNKYAVGVMPLDARACPAENLVTIYTDDEDDNNESDYTGFELPQTVRRARRKDTGRGGTTWKFCKVDGRDFKSLTMYAAKTHYFYATLKLGLVCPNGSIDFKRHVDGEHDNNQSRITGPGAPNAKSSSSMVFNYCLFGANTDKMASFPDLGMSYAIFHDYDGAQPDHFIAKRWVYSDDEDFRNFNNTSPFGGSDFLAFEAMVGGGTNTWYDIAQVQ